ncbi:hypothetical protein Bca4012_011398 [Brassica carinata]
MCYTGARGVAALHRHKYSGVDHSYVAKYVLQPFLESFLSKYSLSGCHEVVTDGESRRWGRRELRLHGRSYFLSFVYDYSKALQLKKNNRGRRRHL